MSFRSVVLSLCHANPLRFGGAIGLFFLPLLHVAAYEGREDI